MLILPAAKLADSRPCHHGLYPIPGLLVLNWTISHCPFISRHELLFNAYFWVLFWETFSSVFVMRCFPAAVQEVYKKREKLQLADNIDHFFNNIDRLADPEYIPSYDDIIRYAHARYALINNFLDTRVWGEGVGDSYSETNFESGIFFANIIGNLLNYFLFCGVETRGENSYWCSREHVLWTIFCVLNWVLKFCASHGHNLPHKELFTFFGFDTQGFSPFPHIKLKIETRFCFALSPKNLRLKGIGG